MDSRKQQNTLGMQAMPLHVQRITDRWLEIEGVAGDAVRYSMI